MKSKILLFSILVFSLLAVNSVYAALTVTPSLTKSLTENEQVTVTVTVANSAGSSTESSLVTELSSSPAWFSVVTACSSLTSLSGGSSQTSTCIIKPTSTGSDLTLTATSTSQGGISGSGSTSGINVASQSSSLTASISSASSVGTSATFYVGTTVVAPSANDVINVKATISVSSQSQCEVVETSGGGPADKTQSLGDITKGTTKSVTNWKLSSSSGSGTCSVTVNVISDVGGSASLSKSITVGTASTSTSSGTSGGAGGGAGGGGAAAAKPKVLVGEKEAIITIASIPSKSESNFSIDSKTVAITAMKITATNTVSNVQITVTKLDSRPRDVVSDAPGVVSQYLNIDKVNITSGDIGNVTMDFKVEKSWVSSNNINESTISLHRYVNDNWNKLETKKVTEDDTNVYYQAVSPGLSVFAIAGESKSIPGAPSVEQPAVEKKRPGEEFVENLKKDSWKIVIAIVGVALVAAIIYLKGMRSPKTKSKSR